MDHINFFTEIVLAHCWWTVFLPLNCYICPLISTSHHKPYKPNIIFRLTMVFNIALLVVYIFKKCDGIILLI